MRTQLLAPAFGGDNSKLTFLCAPVLTTKCYAPGLVSFAFASLFGSRDRTPSLVFLYFWRVKGLEGAVGCVYGGFMSEKVI
jgi:hypothetical protein